MKKELHKENIKEIQYFIIQKIIGLIVIAGTIWLCLSGALYDSVSMTNDCTIALVFVPLGIYLCLSKKHIINIWGYQYEEVVKNN